MFDRIWSPNISRLNRALDKDNKGPLKSGKNVRAGRSDVIWILRTLYIVRLNTPNANMADHSVGARDEFHESEASEASVFCFDNASPE